MKDDVIKFLKDNDIAFQISKPENNDYNEYRFYEIFFRGDWLTVYDFDLTRIRIHSSKDEIVLEFTNRVYDEKLITLDSIGMFAEIMLQMMEIANRQIELKKFLEEAK